MTRAFTENVQITVPFSSSVNAREKRQCPGRFQGESEHAQDGENSLHVAKTQTRTKFPHACNHTGTSQTRILLRTATEKSTRTHLRTQRMNHGTRSGTQQLARTPTTSSQNSWTHNAQTSTRSQTQTTTNTYTHTNTTKHNTQLTTTTNHKHTQALKKIRIKPNQHSKASTHKHQHAHPPVSYTHLTLPTILPV